MTQKQNVGNAMVVVDVQHQISGEWTRRFKTYEEAERYMYHVTNERRLVASIRMNNPADQEHC